MNFVAHMIRNADAADADMESAMAEAIAQEPILQPDKSDPSFLARNVECTQSMAKHCREEEAWFASEIVRLTQEMNHRRISAEAFEMAHGRMSDGQ